MKYQIEGLDPAITIKKYEIKNGDIVLKMIKKNPKNAYYATEHTEEAEEKTNPLMDKLNGIEEQLVALQEIVTKKSVNKKEG